ncbi:MAG: transglycosylase SLT domain-containing protein [Neisseriaceae bacterium]
MKGTKLKLIVGWCILGIVSACATAPRSGGLSAPKQIPSRELPVQIIPEDGSWQNDAEIMSEYQWYSSVLEQLKNGSTELAEEMLQRHPTKSNAMLERVQLELLKILGAQSRWEDFSNYYKKLSTDIHDNEIACYAAMAGILPLNDLAAKWVKSNEALSNGCNKMLETAALRHLLQEKDIWRRVRILIANNRLSLAKSLVSTTGYSLVENSANPKISSISKLFSIVTQKGRNRPDLESAINSLYGVVDPEEIAFAEGIAGLSRAKDLEMSLALQHFDRADRSQLSKTQWEWYARAALRLKNWRQLGEIIESMPKEIQENPTWWYWLARVKSTSGNINLANKLYHKAAASGRNFYSVLAHEELNLPITTVSNSAHISSAQLVAMERNTQIHRALVLLKNSLVQNDKILRAAAREQWNYAIRNFPEEALLVASALAARYQFYEMSISSADKSDQHLNFKLRFPTPYKDLIDNYAKLYSIESSRVLGLIRQESRFMRTALSNRGAMGLMQLLPASAQRIAQQIGLEGADLSDIGTNLNLGIWYLADLYRQFSSEPVVISAYNAGPSRARKWRQPGLEGAIYVETIPFNETREYVKRVMKNTFYYSRLLNATKTSLKARLGTL